MIAITEDRIELIVLGSMLLGLRSRKVVMEPYVVNIPSMIVDDRLLDAEIEALEHRYKEVQKRVNSLSHLRMGLGGGR